VLKYSKFFTICQGLRIEFRILLHYSLKLTKDLICPAM